MLTPIRYGCTTYDFRSHEKPDPEMQLKHPKYLDDGSIASLDQISKIIHVSKKRKIWSSSTNHIKDLAVLSQNKYTRFWDKDRNRFDQRILDDGQCYYNHIYRYCFVKGKWIDITKEINIENSYLISGNRAGLPQLKSMLSQVFLFNDFHGRSEIDSLSSVEVDKSLRNKLNKSVPSATDLEISKDSKPLWKKFVGNVKSFVSSDSIEDTTRYQIYLAKEKERQNKRLAIENERRLRNQLLCNRPSTWVLRKTRSDYTSILDFYKKSRYIVFRLKDHAYLIGGNTSIHEKDRSERLVFEKYDFKKHRWTESEHNLLYPLQYATIALSSDQTFAIFIVRSKPWKRRGKETTRIIMFEEETGFTLLEDKKLGFINDDDDVAIVI